MPYTRRYVFLFVLLMSTFLTTRGYAKNDFKVKLNQIDLSTVLNNAVIAEVTLQSGPVPLTTSISDDTLQIESNFTAITDTLCKSNVPGVGILYYDYDGKLAKNSCSTRVAAAQLTGIFPFRGYSDHLYAKFIVYDRSLLKTGLFTILLGPRTYTYQYGHSESTQAYNINNPRVNFFITDSGAGLIFPEFPSNDPHLPINLVLSGNRNATVASAHTKVEMCMNDSQGVNSSQFQITFKDSSLFSGSGQTFHMVRVGGQNTDADLINYQISIHNPKTRQFEPVTINTPKIWTNITSGNSEVVNWLVAGKRITCAYTPLNIDIPVFSYNKKNEGHYQGIFNIEFTPTLNN